MHSRNSLHRNIETHSVNPQLTKFDYLKSSQGVSKQTSCCALIFKDISRDRALKFLNIPNTWSAEMCEVRLIVR